MPSELLSKLHFGISFTIKNPAAILHIPFYDKKIARQAKCLLMLLSRRIYTLLTRQHVINFLKKMILVEFD